MQHNSSTLARSLSHDTQLSHRARHKLSMASVQPTTNSAQQILKDVSKDAVKRTNALDAEQTKSANDGRHHDAQKWETLIRTHTRKAYTRTSVQDIIKLHHQQYGASDGPLCEPQACEELRNSCNQTCDLSA